MNSRIIKISFYFGYIAFIFCLNAEAYNKKSTNKSIEIKSADDLLKEADGFFADNKTKKAIKKYEDLVLMYPFSRQGDQAQLMLGYIDFLNKDWDSASERMREYLVRKKEYDEDTAYATYMIARGSYEKLTKNSRDLFLHNEVLEHIDYLCQSFPNSTYADAIQKIKKPLQEKVASMNANIGFYYAIKNHKSAAENRLNEVIKSFGETVAAKKSEQALYILDNEKPSNARKMIKDLLADKNDKYHSKK